MKRRSPENNQHSDDARWKSFTVGFTHSSAFSSVYAGVQFTCVDWRRTFFSFFFFSPCFYAHHSAERLRSIVGIVSVGVPMNESSRLSELYSFDVCISSRAVNENNSIYGSYFLPVFPLVYKWFHNTWNGLVVSVGPFVECFECSNLQLNCWKEEKKKKTVCYWWTVDESCVLSINIE